MNERVVLKQRAVVRRKKKKSPFLKGFFVVLFATVLTTLAIQASDKYTIPGTSFLAGVGNAGPIPHCPPEMAYIPHDGGGYCIDRYETSAGKHCPYYDPSNEFQSQSNLTNPLCVPTAEKNKRPWVNAPFHEALRACAQAGKRLPTNNEWYRASLGTPDAVMDGDATLCALGHTGQASADDTGVHDRCVSSYGVYDMVGNVWEWVDGSVMDGIYDRHELPADGFVAEVDTDGVPTQTATSSTPSFGGDYFYVDKTGVRGMMRGGFWSLKDKAGPFSMNATIPLSFVGNAVGFRCVKDAQ